MLMLLLVVGDVGVVQLFVMFKEFILLFVEFKLLLLQLLLLAESAYDVMANGGDEAVFEASDDVDVVRSLMNVPSGRTRICFVPII